MYWQFHGQILSENKIIFLCCITFKHFASTLFIELYIGRLVVGIQLLLIVHINVMRLKLMRTYKHESCLFTR